MILNLISFKFKFECLRFVASSVDCFPPMKSESCMITRLLLMNDFLLNFMRSGDLDLLTFQSCGVSGYTFHCKLCNITVNQTAIRNIINSVCVGGSLISRAIMNIIPMKFDQRITNVGARGNAVPTNLTNRNCPAPRMLSCSLPSVN